MNDKVKQFIEYLENRDEGIKIILETGAVDKLICNVKKKDNEIITAKFKQIFEVK